MTLTLSANIISNGEAIIKNPDGDFLSSSVSSNSYSGVFGIDLTLLEVLIGMRKENIEYKDFYNKTNQDALNSDFQIKGEQFIIWIGKSF